MVTAYISQLNLNDTMTQMTHVQHLIFLDKNGIWITLFRSTLYMLYRKHDKIKI